MKEVKRYSGVIVKCGDEVLLCKRNATGSLPGQWSIPGGSLEKDEHPMDGIQREFEEETSYGLTQILKQSAVDDANYTQVISKLQDAFYLQRVKELKISKESNSVSLFKLSMRISLNDSFALRIILIDENSYL